MVAEIQNALISVYRGWTFNQFGDVQADRQPFLIDIPAALLENQQTVLDPATQTPMTVRQAVCIVPSWTGVLNSDQIVDQSNGDVFAIESIVRPPTLTGAPVDLRLMLRRITATGT